MVVVWIISGVGLAIILSILCPTDGEERNDRRTRTTNPA